MSNVQKLAPHCSAVRLMFTDCASFAAMRALHEHLDIPAVLASARTLRSISIEGRDLPAPIKQPEPMPNVSELKVWAASWLNSIRHTASMDSVATDVGKWRQTCMARGTKGVTNPEHPNLRRVACTVWPQTG
jgi:hypothetical protein